MVKNFFLICLTIISISFPVFSKEDYNRGLVYIINDNIHWRIAGELLTTNPKTVRRMHLDSRGGKVESAILIAQYVRENNIVTYVGKDQKCYSSCTLVFQAGVQRIAHRSAMFMYHYATTKRDIDGKKLIIPNLTWTSIINSYLLKFGIMPDLIEQMHPNIDIYLTAEEAMWFGIVTSIED